MRRDFSAFGDSIDAVLETAAGPRYTGKDYDEDAELYYFNARWYDAELGRFTAEDPIKDGTNWYAYVGNRPLVYTDPTGLVPAEGAGYVKPGPAYFNQRQFNAEAGFSQDFGDQACYATSILNELSEEYTEQTGQRLSFDQATEMMQAAVDAGDSDGTKARILDNNNIADSMWSATGLDGDWGYRQEGGYSTEGDHEVFQRDGHFEGSYTGGYDDDHSHAYDPWNGSIDDVSDGRMDGEAIRSTRIFSYTRHEDHNNIE